MWDSVGDSLKLKFYLDIGRVRGAHTPCDCHVENPVPLLDPVASAVDSDTTVLQTGKPNPTASELHNEVWSSLSLTSGTSASSQLASDMRVEMLTDAAVWGHTYSPNPCY